MQSDTSKISFAQNHRESVKRLVDAWKILTGEDLSELFGIPKEGMEGQK